jgi:hypothetical protein
MRTTILIVGMMAFCVIATKPHIDIFSMFTTCQESNTVTTPNTFQMKIGDLLAIRKRDASGFSKFSLGFWVFKYPGAVNEGQIFKWKKNNDANLEEFVVTSDAANAAAYTHTQKKISPGVALVESTWNHVLVSYVVDESTPASSTCKFQVTTREGVAVGAADNLTTTVEYAACANLNLHMEDRLILGGSCDFRSRLYEVKLYLDQDFTNVEAKAEGLASIPAWVADFYSHADKNPICPGAGTPVETPAT